MDKKTLIHPDAALKILTWCTRSALEWGEHGTADLAWTIVAPSGLTDDPGTGTIEVGDRVSPRSVPRADVAQVILAVLEDPATAGSTIEFNAGPTPIADAVARFETGSGRS